MPSGRGGPLVSPIALPTPTFTPPPIPSHIVRTVLLSRTLSQRRPRHYVLTSPPVRAKRPHYYIEKSHPPPLHLPAAGAEITCPNACLERPLLDVCLPALVGNHLGVFAFRLTEGKLSYHIASRVLPVCSSCAPSFAQCSRLVPLVPVASSVVRCCPSAACLVCVCVCLGVRVCPWACQWEA